MVLHFDISVDPETFRGRKASNRTRVDEILKIKPAIRSLSSSTAIVREIPVASECTKLSEGGALSDQFACCASYFARTRSYSFYSIAIQTSRLYVYTFKRARKRFYQRRGKNSNRTALRFWETQ